MKVGQSSAEQRGQVREALLAALTDPGFGGRDKYKYRTAADYAYDALWALEVAVPVYRPGEVL